MGRHRKMGLSYVGCVAGFHARHKTAAAEAAFHSTPASSTASWACQKREKRSPCMVGHESESAAQKTYQKHRARSHARSRTRYAGRVRLHTPAAHRNSSPGTLPQSLPAPGEPH